MFETVINHSATPWVGLLIALGLTIGFVIGHRPRPAVYDLVHIVVPAAAIFAGFQMWLAFETAAWLTGMAAFAAGGIAGVTVAIALRRPIRPAAA